MIIIIDAFSRETNRSDGWLRKGGLSKNGLNYEKLQAFNLVKELLK